MVSGSGSQAVSRSLALMKAVTEDGGRTPAAQIFPRLGLASSTGRRLLLQLVDHGFLVRTAHGRYMGGEQLRQLAAQTSPHARLVKVARPILRRLAGALGATAYLGTFEGEMVTYLVKEGAQTGFTREQMQLEAYCTGIGKVLLAQLVPARLDAYLAAPLISLTAHTITDPGVLRAELKLTLERGYAIDDREMSEDLGCVAVPLPQLRGSDYAISLSGAPGQCNSDSAPAIADQLRLAAEEIARHI